ncbi:acyltransferase family protein [Hymenobacter sp. B81]|uniref:acyltransferase family protein n=1 Tax=Hymenobacter sp. B81 TaxID=3344878 RepID=UPI0037DD85B7
MPRTSTTLPLASPPPTAAAPRSAELDLLRFLASLVVVLTHFTYSMPRIAHLGPSFPLLGGVFRYGYLAVDLFFMISGYVVLKSARHKSLRQFVTARITRLYPAFWLSCLLTFAGLYLSGSLPANPATLRQLVFNLTMLHEFLGYPSLNGVYWSLTYELTFCFLVGLIIAGRLWPWLWPIMLGWLSYTLVAGPLPPNHLFSYLFIPKHSAWFIAGMLFYLLQTRQRPAWQVGLALLAAFALALRSDRAERLLNQQFYHDAPSTALSPPPSLPCFSWPSTSFWCGSGACPPTRAGTGWASSPTPSTCFTAWPASSS